MGLRSLLTKQLSLSSAVLHWKEPVLFRIRLKQDLGLRLLLIVAAWLGSAGILLVLFSLNVNPTDRSLAFLLGLIGAGAAYLLLLSRSGHVSGSCWMYQDKLLWQSMSAGFLVFQSNWAEWYYEEIDKCLLIPPETSGHSFGLMLLVSDGERLLIGVPDSVELRQVGQLLTRHGVNVSRGRQVPAEFCQPVSLAAAIPLGIIGVVLLTAGLLLHQPADGDNARELARPDIGIPVNEPPAPMIRNPSQNSPPNAIGVPNPGSSSAGGVFPEPMPPVPVPDSGRFSNNVEQPGDSSVGSEVASAEDIQTTDSELLGGSGGIPFRMVSPDGRPLLGVRYSLGSWAGRQRVGQLQPVFGYPTDTARDNLIVGRAGYVVGAVRVDADDLVNAVQLVFMRQKSDGSLDLTDKYESSWVGTADPARVRTLSADDQPAVGLYGRGAAVVDALGVVWKMPRS